MRIYLNWTLLSLTAALFLSNAAKGQESAIYNQPGRDYLLASELFQKKHYGAARFMFDDLTDQQSNSDFPPQPDMEFMDAISATEMTNADGPARVSNFVNDYPENALKGEASFYLGKNLFRENKYKEAIRALQEVDAAKLSRESREELNFMLGYAQLKSGNITAAKGNFQRITNQKSPYYGQAKYFLAHIDYLSGNYQQALKSFEQIEKDRRYYKIVPMYKIQIYHYLGENEKILELGPAMVESSATTNKAEVARITANACFNTGDFEKAAYYMDIFERTSRRTMTREDQYLLGFVSYLGKDYKGAIGNFQAAIKQNDALSQNACYYLGICYNETGQKKYAANAFLSAYKAGFDPEINEESLFNYIKIGLEYPSNPYNEAISLLESYLKENPGSPRSNEGYGYLSQLYLSSRNYKQALVSIETMNDRTPVLDKVYQQILLYRAGELFNTNDMDAALELYQQASRLSYDEPVKAEALYWSGEIAYRQGNYPSAIKYFRDFLASRQSKSLPIYPLAYYNLGYAYFNSEEYSNAIAQFNRFLETGYSKDRSLISDANLRLGDASFISNHYDKAISHYDKVITAKENSMDYALYYKALSEGARGDFARKIDVLKVLVNNYPKSGYVDDALYEIALSYILLNQESQALTWFDRLIRDFPTTTKATQAWLRKGFIYYNRDDNNQAISSFKHVIEKFSTSQEAQEALAALKNIYVESGQVEQYYTYARNLSFAEIDASEEDSLSYEAAGNLYMKGQYEQSIQAFRNYIDRFPNGAYVTNALFNMGECNLKANRKNEAVEYFMQAASRPKSGFTEIALVKASNIEYSSGNYDEALIIFEQLEVNAENPDNLAQALAGQMKCHLKAKNYSSAAGAARKLLDTGQAAQDAIQEAHFALGHGYLAEDNITEAATEFRMIGRLKGSEMGADATYQLAWIAFQTDKLNEAEDYIYILSEEFAAFDYWVAKGFILLSDVFVKNGNTFQARQTLQSVIDNYSGPELGEIARSKLDLLESD